MSVVFSLPHGASYPQMPVAPGESLARANNAAQLAYQRLITERASGITAGQVLLSEGPKPVEIPIAVPVQPTAVPIAMAWSAPAGANCPTAQAVSAAATAIPTTATVVPAAPAIAVAAPVSFAPASFPTAGAVRRQSSAAQPQLQMPIPLAGIAPQVVAAPAVSPVPASPMRPPNLTEGLPDPTSVDRQKLQHARTLLDRLQADTAILTQQNQVRKQMLAQYGAQQKAQHTAKVDADLQREAMAVEQRGNAQLLQLQQAVVAQTMALEQQAAGLTLKYHTQVAEEDRMQKDYYIQRQFYQAEVKIAEEMQKISRGQCDAVMGASNSVTILGSERRSYRDTNSFDAYLGNPGGRPIPRGPSNAELKSSNGSDD